MLDSLFLLRSKYEKELVVIEAKISVVDDLIAIEKEKSVECEETAPEVENEVVGENY